MNWTQKIGSRRRRSTLWVACLLALLCVSVSASAEEDSDAAPDAVPEEAEEGGEDGAQEETADAGEPGDEDSGSEDGVAAEVEGDADDAAAEAQEEGDDSDEEAEEEATAEPERPDARLFVLPTDSVQGELSDIVTQRINDAIRSRLGTLGGIELLPTFEALHGEASGDEVHSALADAERGYTSGIGLVNAGDYEAAAEVLQRAVRVLEENVAQLQNFGILTDAMANLSIAYFNTGYDLDARDNIRRFAQIQPDADLDLDDYPELQALYQDEVERVEQAGHSKLNITANRDGAQVFINGELRGETPLTIEEFGFGQHFMVVRHGDWIVSEIIQVRGRDEEHDIEVELRDAADEDEYDDGLPSFYVDLRNTLQSGQFGSEMDPYLQELASQTGADYLAWTLVLRDNGAYAVAPFMYRVEDATLIQGEDIIFNQELSNLRSRANQLSDTVAASVVHMADDQVVDQVDLAPLPEEPVVADAPDDEVESEDAEEVAMAPDETPSDPLPVPDERAGYVGDEVRDPMIDEEPDDGSNTFMYLGLGGAAAGIIAGTVFMLVRSPSPAGFEAEVEW